MYQENAPILNEPGPPGISDPLAPQKVVTGVPARQGWTFPAGKILDFDVIARRRGTRNNRSAIYIDRHLAFSLPIDIDALSDPGTIRVLASINEKS